MCHACLFLSTVVVLLTQAPSTDSAPTPPHSPAAQQPAENLDIPAEKIIDCPPGMMMHNFFLRQARQAAARRQAEYDKLATPDDLATYQRNMREKCLSAIGGLPERTPLNPRITGTIDRQGYKVEKVVFESQPNHYVTALVFVPDKNKFKPPYPGVLVPCGHSLEGKAYPAYQTFGALLALNGMAAMVFDPIDQGERGQYLGKGGWPELSSVQGHIMVGIGSILLGQNTARFEIWDGIRAIDYLQSRADVDPRRIGCAGCSGGGTQTSYLMALDDRIAAAAPSCYLTSFPRLLATIGPQDAEQNIFGQLNFPMDHADWILMRAPSPVLVCAATQDFFDISGTWDTFRAAKRIYSRLGQAQNLDIVEDPGKHGLNEVHRRGATQWMSRWLLDKDQRVVEPKIELLSKEECRCLPDKTVMTLPRAVSVYDLNEQYEKELAEHRAAAWQTADKSALLEKVRQLAGVRKLNELPLPKIDRFDCVERQGYKIEKLVIRPEEGIALPALLFLPDEQHKKPGRVTLYLHEKGKAADAAPGGPIENLVLAGQTALAVDLRGAGQTTSDFGKSGYNPKWQTAAEAYLLGRSCVGMWTEDILISAVVLAQLTAVDQQTRIDLVAVGNLGIPALHAAALEPRLFHAVKISGTLASWADIIHRRISRDQMPNVVHGALAHYNLPDLAAVLGNKLSIIDPVDAQGNYIKPASNHLSTEPPAKAD